MDKCQVIIKNDCMCGLPTTHIFTCVVDVEGKNEIHQIGVCKTHKPLLEKRLKKK